MLLVLTYLILDPSDFVYSLGRVNVRGAEVSAPPPQENCRVKTSCIVLYLLLVPTYRILDPSDFLYSLGRVNLRGAEVSDPPPRKM